MSMTVHYKHISPWLLGLFEKQHALIELFVVALPQPLDPGHRPFEAREGMGDLMGMLDEIDDEMEEEMREEIERIVPRDAPKILEEAKTGGFTLDKEYAIVQFHLSGEVADH